MSIPFNIDLWKAGRKVTTRDGREVKQLTHYDADNWQLVGILDGELKRWKINGSYGYNVTCPLDLIHPDEEVVVEVYHPCGLTPKTQNRYCSDSIPPGKYKLVKIN